ncbi:MAG TPA: hypothetical protein PLJ47_01430 [Candidatus Hydrogenedentes bacterium]|nr:hypothetical protein [Candidatus Hydrogenedentota bacterium]
MRSRSASLVLAIFSIVCVSTFACGPFFPNAYFALGLERQVLYMPEASFFHELCRTLGVTHQDDASEADYGGEWPRTIKADMVSLEFALQTANVSAERITGTLTAYRSIREASRGLMENAGADTPARTRELAAQLEASLADAPREFVLYAQGAALYSAGLFEEAEAKWAELLALPRDQRAHRSVWAAYMLGRSKRDRDADSAVAAFAQARELAAAGFGDPLGLSAESLGWQAHIENARLNHVNAIRLYSEQFAQGGTAIKSAHLSLDFTCARAAKSEDALRDIAQDDVCRRIMTAWVVSHPGSPEPAKAWLRAVSSAGLPSNALQADLLAWTAYTHGDFQAAENWSESPVANTAVGNWVRAKLQLRTGNVDDAIATLRGAIEMATANPSSVIESVDDGYAAATPMAMLAQRELGVLLLGQEKYLDALDLFVRAGYWIDAAYIAERVLTVDELIAYTEARTELNELRVPVFEPIWYYDVLYAGSTDRDENGEFMRPSRGILLQYIIARRLIREGRLQDALRYVPEPLLPTAKDFVAAIETGRPDLPPKTEQSAWEWFLGRKPRVVVDRERAQALSRAGTIARQKGMELMGTELGPDWAVFGGNFTLSGIETVRLRPTSATGGVDLPNATKSVLHASSDEIHRAWEHVAVPNKRFHYRYVAAELQWDCSALLPKNDVDNMVALWRGGTYIKNLDPAAANKFYRALVWRNLNMPYAKDTDRYRWFLSDEPR